MTSDRTPTRPAARPADRPTPTVLRRAVDSRTGVEVLVAMAEVLLPEEAAAVELERPGLARVIRGPWARRSPVVRRR